MWFSTRSFPLVAAAETTSNNALPGTWLASSIKTCQGAAHSVTAPANNSNLLQGLDEQLMQWHRQNGVLVLTKKAADTILQFSSLDFQKDIACIQEAWRRATN